MLLILGSGEIPAKERLDKADVMNKVVIAGIVLIIIVIGANFYFKGSKVANLTAKPFIFNTYVPPKIEKKSLYTIVMVGDSMTNALGPHGGTFNTFINALYKPDNIGILVDNYGMSSTSILTINKAMTTTTTYWDSTFPPLLSRPFDLILIESFGYNPLSQFPLTEGLAKQTQILTDTMTTLITTHPQAAVVFVATIAPNKETYALKELPNLTAADRLLEVEERTAYIKNHISFAQSHQIPLIDIYDKSLTASGDGDLSLINPDDNIHPSFKGVDFIGHELANYIYDNQILPNGH